MISNEILIVTIGSNDEEWITVWETATPHVEAQCRLNKNKTKKSNLIYFKLVFLLFHVQIYYFEKSIKFV